MLTFLIIFVILYIGFRWIPSNYEGPRDIIGDPVWDGRLHHLAETPDLSKSRLWGVEKLHPLWMLSHVTLLPSEWKPSWPRWWRILSWHTRNPLFNWGSYVFGVADRDFYRTGVEPLNSFWLSDGRRGFKWNLIHCPPFLYLPCVSYRGRWIEFHLGWNERGKFGFALRKALAKNHDAHNGHDDKWWRGII